MRLCSRRTIVPRLLCLLVLCGTSGCNKKAVVDRPSPPKDAVARVGPEIITVDDFQDAMRTRPVGNDLRARAALLGEMIEFRALVQEAKARGYEGDPEIKAAFERLLANKVRAADETTEPQISPEEIETYYRAHQQQFTVPAKIRVAMIFVEAGKLSTDEKRAERRAKIVEARAKAQSQPTPVDTQHIGFGPLAAEYSYDQATKYKGGDLGYLLGNVDGKDVDGLDQDVVKAAFALSEIGQISDVLTTTRGYYLLKLLERQPATIRPLSSVGNQIGSRLKQEKVRKARESFAAAILAGKSVEIHSDRLDAIPVPTVRPETNSGPNGPPRVPDTGN